ncbi:MAG: hypothetical protein WC788_02750 [Candidatus Paceibacterota bacterium]
MIQEAIIRVHEEAELGFQGSSCDNCALYNIRKLTNERGMKHLQSQ